MIGIEVTQLGPENKGENAVETISIRSTNKKSVGLKQQGTQMSMMNSLPMSPSHHDIHQLNMMASASIFAFGDRQHDQTRQTPNGDRSDVRLNNGYSIDSNSYALPQKSAKLQLWDVSSVDSIVQDKDNVILYSTGSDKNSKNDNDPIQLQESDL